MSFSPGLLRPRADEAHRRVGQAVAREHVAEQLMVEFIQSDAEGLILVFELRDVRREVEHRQLRPAVFEDVIDLALVEAEVAQHVSVRELRLGEPFAVDVPIHVLPPRPRQHGQVELPARISGTDRSRDW